VLGGVLVDTQLRDDPNRFAQRLFEGLPRHYDFLEETLSLGQNRRWRGAMVDSVVGHRPTRVLDVATGTAGVAVQLTRRTAASVVGVDVTPAMLHKGRERVRADGAAERVSLVAGRGEQLPFPDASFDALTFTYLLRYVADPAATLRELVRVLAPGAPMASLEFFVPPSRFWRFWWRGYTRFVLPAAGALAGSDWWRVGRFLGPNIDAHYRRYPIRWTVEAWRAAGMTDVTVRTMSLGGGLVMWGTKAKA
jgi:demethylmenaquinone methyltransferase/2-methoxy-6-polyprenyl-1,4-benzoquinol methylase